jgi:hypothetical protein
MAACRTAFRQAFADSRASPHGWRSGTACGNRLLGLLISKTGSGRQLLLAAPRRDDLVFMVELFEAGKVVP